MRNIVKFWDANTILEGEKVMANTRCAICCMVRDCRASFENNLNTIIELRALFKDSYLILIENDSKDGTKELVREIQQNHSDVWIDSFDTGLVTLPKKMNSGVNPSFSEYRVRKMADYRNRYIQVLESNVGFDELDWVMIIDPDVKHISLSGIKHSFGLEGRWDVVHANGRQKMGLFNDVYYDVYAFSEYGDYSPCTEQKMRLHAAQMRGVKKGMPLVPVRSGFNALAIYRASGLKGLKYRCEKNADKRVEVICEHIPFHDDLSRAGFDRHFLNPTMVIEYNTRLQAVVAWLKSLVRRYILRRG